MVKPMPVPSSNVLRDDTVSDASETNNTPSLSSETNIPAQKQQSSTSAPNGTVNGLQHIKQKSKVSSIAARAMAALNDDGSSDSDSEEDNVSASALENAKEASGVHETNNTPSSDTNNIPTIDFTAVFNELLKYKEENNGSLSIPTSHCTLSNIVDSLSKPSIDIESLANQRWDGHLNKLIEYMNSKKKYTDINTLVSKSTWYKKQPKLVEWVDIQRQQCKLYSQEDDDCVLTKKRAKKLKRLGFDIGKEEKSSKGDDIVQPSDGRESKKRSKPSQEDTSTRKKIKVEDDALLMKQESTDVEDMVKVDQEDTIPADDEMKVAAEMTRIKGKCDVCEKVDGFWGHNMQKCRSCGLLVHEACYGIPATDVKNDNFICHACNAIGRYVEVNVPSKIGGTGKRMGEKRQRMSQSVRPRECVLCSHDKGGKHAMHPLLDVHGKEGRQLVWRGHDGGEERLAWVHTVCAGVVAGNPRTNGCVYGCGPDRERPNEGYDKDQQSSSEEEFGESDQEMKPDRSKKKLPPTYNENTAPEIVANEYYAISAEGDRATIIKDSRELKCSICRKIDREYMIPVQCPAGEETEHKPWKKRHRRGTECFEAMHVGCARWGCVEPEGSHLSIVDGGSRYVDKVCKRCYYTPGKDKDDSDTDEENDEDKDEDSNDEERVDTTVTVAHCYCEKHAKDIIINNPKRIAAFRAAAAARSPRIEIQKKERR